MSASAHQRALALMLLSAAAFTANVLLVRALNDLHFANIWLVSSARFVVGLGVVAVVYRREWQPLNLVRNPRLIERGLLGGFGVYLTYLCVVKLGAGRATFINNTYVIWGALLAAWVLREKLQPALLVGGVLALTGLSLLTNVFATGSAPGLYDWLAVLSALVSAWVVVTIRQLHATEHSSTIFAAQCVYGLLLCGLPALLQLQPISGLGLAVTAIASVTAAVGQLAMTRAFRDLSVAEGSLLQMLVPLGIATGGALFFHERFSPHELAGAALILGGTGLTALRRPARAKATVE
jgi:drug/metabolite transporter (DMT)-like permease